MSSEALDGPPVARAGEVVVRLEAEWRTGARDLHRIATTTLALPLLEDAWG